MKVHSTKVYFSLKNVYSPLSLFFLFVFKSNSLLFFPYNFTAFKFLSRGNEGEEYSSNSGPGIKYHISLANQTRLSEFKLSMFY